MNKKEEKEMLDAGERFMEDEMRRYEEWLEQPTPFWIRVHNWIVRFKERCFFMKERIRIYFYNRRHPDASKNWVEYCKGVHECYERKRAEEKERKKEE